MRHIFYYYSYNGMLILNYKDDHCRKRMAYMYYTLRGAIRKFRQDNNLRYKHITVTKLY